VRAAFELLCFDLDGTLVDSAPDLSDSLGNALTSVDLPPPTEAQTRGWIGDGIDNLIHRALADAGADQPQVFKTALAAFHASYAQNLFSRSRLYPEVENVLQQLADAGHRICCITNKRSDYAEKLLGLAGIADRFEFTFGGDSFAEKKPHPQQLLEAANLTGTMPGSCVMIGDSDTDSAAALSAGFEFIWAAFGYCPQLSTREINGIASASQFADIPKILLALMP
jgi:phosphoglycolate phosphatase